MNENEAIANLLKIEEPSTRVLRSHTVIHKETHCLNVRVTYRLRLMARGVQCRLRRTRPSKCLRKHKLRYIFGIPTIMIFLF